MRLVRSDIDPFEAGQWLGVEPRAIRQQRVAPDIGDCGFQMQAAGHRDADHFLSVWRSDRSELPNAFRVGPAGLPGEEASPDAQDVATFDLARQFDASKFAEFGERLCNRSG